jgi:hypothetical protein
LLIIAFGLGAINAEVARADAIRVQLGGEPTFVNGFAAKEGAPGPVGQK